MGDQENIHIANSKLCLICNSNCIEFKYFVFTVKLFGIFGLWNLIFTPDALWIRESVREKMWEREKEMKEKKKMKENK